MGNEAYKDEDYLVRFRAGVGGIGKQASSSQAVRVVLMSAEVLPRMQSSLDQLLWLTSPDQLDELLQT